MCVQFTRLHIIEKLTCRLGMMTTQSGLKFDKGGKNYLELLK